MKYTRLDNSYMQKCGAICPKISYLDTRNFWSWGIIILFIYNSRKSNYYM